MRAASSGLLLSESSIAKDIKLVRHLMGDITHHKRSVKHINHLARRGHSGSANQVHSLVCVLNIGLGLQEFLHDHETRSKRCYSGALLIALSLGKKRSQPLQSFQAMTPQLNN